MSHDNYIDKLVEELCLVRAVDRVPHGHLRLETKLTYPDGSSIDLFVLNPPSGLPYDTKLVLSDLAQTTMWLAELQVKPWQSKKRQRLLEDALYILNIRQNGGALETDVAGTHEALEDAVIRLGQACVRVADLAFTRRSSLQVNAGDEVEEILSDAELPYEPNVQLPGRYGNVVVVDFLVHGPRRPSAVMTLAAQYPGSAHRTANDLFCKLHDLDVPGRHEQKVTVYDDRYDVYREEDLKRIRDLSELVPLSERRYLATLLAA